MGKQSHTEVKRCPQCGYIEEDILTPRCPRCCKPFNTPAACCGNCSNCGTELKMSQCESAKNKGR